MYLYKAKLFAWINRKPDTIGPSPFQEDLMALPQLGRGLPWNDRSRGEENPYEKLDHWIDLDKAIAIMIENVHGIRLTLLSYLLDNCELPLTEWADMPWQLHKAMSDWV